MFEDFTNTIKIILNGSRFLMYIYIYIYKFIFIT
jgi:hypothetical protein